MFFLSVWFGVHGRLERLCTHPGATPESVRRFLDRDVICDLSHAGDFLGEVSGSILLISRIDEPAQLNRALERFHAYSVVFIFGVFRQRGLDAGRSAMVVNSFARALLVATA